MTRPSSVDLPRRRLADVVEQDGPRQRHERRGAGKAGLVRRRQEVLGLQLGDHVPYVGERLQRVTEDVEVVIRVLLHAAQALHLGKYRGEGAGHGEVAKRGRRPLDRKRRRELVADPLAADSGERRRRRPRRLDRVRLRQEAVAPRETRQAQHAERVLLEGARPAEPEAAGSEVVEPAQRVDQLAALQGTSDGVDREVPAAEVGLETRVARRGVGRQAAECRDVDVATGDDDAPGPEAFGRGEDGAGQPVGEPAREGLLVAVDDEVDVVERVPQKLVADAAAHEPGRLALGETGTGGGGDLVEDETPAAARIAHVAAAGAAPR